MTIPAYPLQWPTGWKRTEPHRRSTARFGRAGRIRPDGNWDYGRQLTVAEAVDRLRGELSRMNIHDDDLVISTDLQLRLDGLPRSGQAEPQDPGAAAYWRTVSGDTRCMAIDRYDRVADNLAAIAATLEAMRAIERHGGAEILSRAFTGFKAIANDAEAKPWHVVLGVTAFASTNDVRAAYRRARALHHPDRGGDAAAFNAIQTAWADFCRERGISE